MKKNKIGYRDFLALSKEHIENNGGNYDVREVLSKLIKHDTIREYTTELFELDKETVDSWLRTHRQYLERLHKASELNEIEIAATVNRISTVLKQFESLFEHNPNNTTLDSYVITDYPVSDEVRVMSTFEAYDRMLDFVYGAIDKAFTEVEAIEIINEVL